MVAPVRTVDRLLPARCPGCEDRAVPRGDAAHPGPQMRLVGPTRHAIALCERCASLWETPAQQVVPVVQLDLSGGVGRSANSIAVVSARPHDGVAAAIIRSIKYRGRRDLAAPVGILTADAVRTADAVDSLRPIFGSRRLVVTWVPSVAHHRRARGYDVGALIARAAARALGTVAISTLRRLDSTGQTTRSRRERLVGPSLQPIRTTCALLRVVGAEVVLIDDVMTTGASLVRSAAALAAAGIPVALAATFTRVRKPAQRSRLSLPCADR